MKAILIVSLLLSVALQGALPAEDIPLIPRQVLFGNPKKDKPMISPGGTRIAHLAPSNEGVVRAMRAKNLAVSYIVYPDEGHGLYREPNVLDHAAREEEFLARYLKGRLEPVQEIKGTSAEVR